MGSNARQILSVQDLEDEFMETTESKIAITFNLVQMSCKLFQTTCLDLTIIGFVRGQMVDVSMINTKAKKQLFGKYYSVPIGFAANGFHQLVTSEGRANTRLLERPNLETDQWISVVFPQSRSIR